ncbi:MAG: zinc ribbon domain-containing protein [Candidatus Heimdallarchaeota archaeon]|nr:zinc ribbon domain-containing protein [Candidatus Heimdallarchaeota archaeon]
MSIENTIQVQPVKLTQKFGRYTKGIMISAAIILIAAILAIIGIMHQIDIIMTVGFVIVGLSSIIFLVFFILYLSSNRRLGRTNEIYSKTTNRVFISFFYGFLFGVAGAANSYSDVYYFGSQYFLSRLFGIMSLIFFGFAFIQINRLFNEFTQNKLYSSEEKKRKGIPIVFGCILLVIFIDSILRPILYAVFIGKGQYNNWIYNNVNIPFNYTVLGVISVLLSLLFYYLYLLGNDWPKIDDELNEQYFRMEGKTFIDQFKSNILYISTMFMVSTFLSSIYVVYYFIEFLRGEDVFELVWSIGIFVGFTIVMLVIFIVRIALNYNKIAQLHSETSNYGIFTVISLSFTPFLLIAGLFSNSEFEILSELYLISRILLLIGMGLFIVGAYFNYAILKKLKLNKEEFEVSKKDLILPYSSLALFILLLIDTVVRKVIFVSLYQQTYVQMEVFNRDFLWLGYVFGSLFFLAVIPTIYGIVTTSREYLRVIPSYGKIPLRLRKSKVEEQIQFYKPEQEQIAAAITVPEKEVLITLCKKCGKDLLERFNFCAYCGEKKNKKLLTCINCGETLEKQFVFCPLCGVKK